MITRITLLAVGLGALLVFVLPTGAYVEAPMSLGAVIAQSTHVMVVRVEKVEKERGLIIYRKVQDLKGQHPTDVIRHNIGKNGFHPREWQTVMEWAEPGKTAVFFHNGGASETFIHNYWYQAYPGGEWWNMSHAEPYLLRSFAGQPEKLAAAVTAILAGQEVVVPCMVDGDKNALQLRSAKIQRLKASLKIQDYNPQRDFVGWGGEDFVPLAGMAAFAQYGVVGRTDPGALGVSPGDFDGDGKIDLCLFGASRVLLLQNGGTSFVETPLPIAGGARAASWADYDGDGKLDLFLATPSGPKLLTNLGGRFRDDSAGLPLEPYYNLTAAAWIDADGDGKPDLLLGNGFLGLRLYRNLGKSVVEPVALGKWHYAGPFDNRGQRGFDRVFPPERGVDLKAKYRGKGDKEVSWLQAAFTDGEINNLALFEGDENNNDAVVYLHRQIDAVADVKVPVSLGSDDTLTAWLNGQRLLAENTYRAAAPDQNRIILPLRKGKNDLLLKVCQGNGEWAFYFQAAAPQAVVAPLFEDQSTSWGLESAVSDGKPKGVYLAVADVNGDGRPDFLHTAGNGVLMLHAGRGFVEAKDSGIQFAERVVATPIFGDVDGDGDVDLFVPLASGGRLFLNDGRGRFTDVTARAGALAAFMAPIAGAAWVDFDKDGKLDLFLGCLGAPNRYFRNLGNGRFADETQRIGLDQRIFNTRGLCILDLNRDGAPDLVMNNEGGDAAILMGNGSR